MHQSYCSSSLHHMEILLDENRKKLEIQQLDRHDLMLECPSSSDTTGRNLIEFNVQ